MGKEHEIAKQADELADALRVAPTKDNLDRADALLDELRKVRQFDRLGSLAELTSRYRPNDLRVRRLLAQSLTEQGKASVAVDVASAALGRAPSNADPEYDELSGILGRAHKQIFMDESSAILQSPLSPAAIDSIERSINAYRKPWERDKEKNTWHGVNLAAMAHVAQTREIDIAKQVNKASIAGEILKSLNATALSERDTWWSATKAEAHVARQEWSEAESAIGNYVSDSSVSAFNYASTLRQFRDVWQVQEQGSEGLGLIQALEAKYLQRETTTEGAPALMLSASHLQSIRAAPYPKDEQLQRVLGSAGTLTLRWYRTGLDRAASVASIRKKMGKRMGTGFAVRSEDFGLNAGEILVLTNFHVVNIEGAGIAARPEAAEIVFEAIDPQLSSPYSIAEVIAQSPSRGGLDFALLRLDRPVQGVQGTPLASSLPFSSGEKRVYLIGHGSGHELQFSLQDNWVLDHEGPPSGSPPRPERLRVHYFAPTHRGSSGSPVFDYKWDCIALHHAGAKHDPARPDSGMRKLNGKDGYWSANEGILMESIREQVNR